MLENTVLNFLAELHKVIEEEPRSYTAAIVRDAIPYLELTDGQTEHLFTEFSCIFRADAELLGDDRIIEHFIQYYPYAEALHGDEGDERFHTNRYVNNFRDNYLQPQLYLLSEEVQESLLAQGLNALSANQTEEGELEVYAENEAGLTFRTLYSQQGEVLNLQEVPNFDLAQANQFQDPTRLDTSTTLEAERTVEEAAETTATTEFTEAFDSHVLTQADQLNDDQLDLAYEAGLQEQAEAEVEEERKVELETIQRNQREYERAEASRIERLAYETKQREDIDAKQRRSRTGRNIAMAAGAGAAGMFGSLASIVIGGDLIGLF